MKIHEIRILHIQTFFSTYKQLKRRKSLAFILLFEYTSGYAPIASSGTLNVFFLFQTILYMLTDFVRLFLCCVKVSKNIFKISIFFVISLGRVVLPSPKIFINLPGSYEKLPCQGEPDRFSG